MFFVSVEQAKQRYSHCKSCEHFNQSAKICRVCNCFMPAKVAIAGQNCPISKWFPVVSDTITNGYSLSNEDQQNS